MRARGKGRRSIAIKSVISGGDSEVEVVTGPPKMTDLRRRVAFVADDRMIRWSARIIPSEVVGRVRTSGTAA
jgi:hypothetical protein